MNLRRSCPDCGRSATGDARFCGTCGAALPAQAVTSSSRRGPVGGPLVVLGGVALLVALVAAGARLATGLAPSADPTLSDVDTWTGHTTASPPAAGTVLWQLAKAPGTEVAAGSATIYVQNGRGVTAVDRSNGSTRWHASEVPGEALAPLPAGVPVADPDGVLRVLDAIDGSLLWSLDGLSRGRANAVSIGAFVVAADEAGITSYDAGGSPAWELEVDDPTWFGRGDDGRGLLFVTNDDGVVAIHPLVGTVAWRASLDGAHGPVSIAEATVVVPADGDRVHGLDLRTGARRWTVTGLTTPVVTDGRVAALATDGDGREVRILSVGSGDVLGSAELPARVHALTVLEGQVVALGERRMWALAGQGTVTWEVAVPGGARAVLGSDERLIVVTPDRVLAMAGPAD